MWINSTTQTLYRFLEDIRKSFPGSSLPANLTDEILAELGIYPVEEIAHPEYTERQKLVAEPPSFEDGRWVQHWAVADMSDEEFAAFSVLKSKEARDERNARLSATDWRFRSDMNPSQEWISYCQALRDLPEQPGFPFNIIWPEVPTEGTK